MVIYLTILTDCPPMNHIIIIDGLYSILSHLSCPLPVQVVQKLQHGAQLWFYKILPEIVSKMLIFAILGPTWVELNFTYLESFRKVF